MLAAPSVCEEANSVRWNFKLSELVTNDVSNVLCCLSLLCVVKTNHVALELPLLTDAMHQQHDEVLEIFACPPITDAIVNELFVH